MKAKKISKRKILAQLILVSSIFAFLYFGVMVVTEKMGGNFKRKDVVNALKHKNEDMPLDDTMVRKIIARKKAQDALTLKFLLVGVSMIGIAYGASLYKKSKK